MTQHQHSRGFTLIELMVVVAIAGVLATLAVPSLVDLIHSSKVNATGRRLFAAFLEAQGLARDEARKFQLRIDRAANAWTICAAADLDEAGTCTKSRGGYSINTDDSNSGASYVRFGPATGLAAAFDAPYDTFSHNAWCSCGGSAVCGGEDTDVCRLEFLPDGSLADEIAGSVILYDQSGRAPTKIALVFVGATGDVRLFSSE